jgi:hypothetical protein
MILCRPRATVDAMSRIRLLALALAALALPASASAKPLKSPKWLKGPIRRYVLTYDATESAHGHEVTTPMVNPETGQPDCSQGTVTDDATSSAHVHLVYRLVFGRDFRLTDTKHRIYRFSAVHGPPSLTRSGKIDSTERTDPPAGCPPADPAHPLPGATCTESVLTRPNLGLDNGNFTLKKQSVFLEVGPNQYEAGFKCKRSGGSYFDGSLHHLDNLVFPEPAQLSAYEAKIRSGKKLTVAIRFPHDGVNKKSDHGTEETVNGTRTWSYDQDFNGTVTLAPGT